MTSGERTESEKKKMIYAYARISTKQQSIERQIRNVLKAYPEAMVIQDTYSGTTMDRPMWRKLYSKLKPGDTVVFDSVSRLARNSDEGFKTYEELYSNNIELIFLKEPQINTTTYKKAKEKAIPLTNTTVDYILEGINKYLLALAREQIILAFEVAQKEVDDLHQRTREGIMTAKLNGKRPGHRKNAPLIHKKSIRCKEYILKYSKDFGGTMNDVDLIKLTECSRKTYYKLKKELLEGHKPL